MKRTYQPNQRKKAKNMVSLQEKKAIFLNQEEKKDVKYYVSKPLPSGFFLK